MPGLSTTITMSENSVCQFCNDAASKYTCPKCQSPYCSMKCYQSQAHSECSEVFYKDCIEDELKLRSKEDKEKNTKKMYQILKNNLEQEEEKLDSDDELDLAERLEGVNLDNTDLVWEKLTEEEKKDFQTLVDNGEISKFVTLAIDIYNI